MKIGAVMPAYNHAAYLAKAIDSVVGQVDALVIVDDGSTDGTTGILSGRSETVITLPENGGAAGAINVGIDRLRANGNGFDFFTWVSSDNVHYTYWMETLLAHVEDDVGAVYAGFDAVPGLGCKKKKHYCFSPYDPSRLGKNQACYMGPNFIIRADIWQSHRGRHAHDYDNWCRVEEACWRDDLRIVAVDKPLCAYLMHKGQATERRVPGASDAAHWLGVCKTRRGTK